MYDGGISTGIIGAVRLHGANGLAGPVNQLVNSKFDNSLSPWQVTNSSAGTSWTDNNGVASLVLPLSRETQAAEDSAIISQRFSNQAAGLGYFFQATVSISMPAGTDDICYVQAYDDAGDQFYLSPYSSAPGFSATVYGSGTLPGLVGVLALYAQCDGHYDASFAIDNVYFYTFGSNQTSSGGTSCTQNGQVLQNSNFNSQFSPWTTSQGDGSAVFSITNGQALVTFGAGTPYSDDPAYITQQVTLPANVDYTLTADIYITISQPDGVCSFTFGNTIDSMYFSGQITSSGYYPLNFTNSFDGDATYFYMAASCDGTNANTVAFDNVFLYVNPSASGAPCKRDQDPGLVSGVASPATQVLANNLFANNSFAHWDTECPSNRATFSIVNNAAIVTFGSISPTSDSPSYVTQDVSTSVGMHTNLLADVSVSILGGGDSCTVSLSTADNLWAQTGITASQTWHVNVNHTIVQAGAAFVMYATCRGSSLATVSFGNVYFTLNAY